MVRKNARKFKTKVKRVSEFSSKPVEVLDQTRFHIFQNAQKFESLVKSRFVWSERQTNLDELDRSMYHNLESRKWLSLCSDLVPPPTALIREFYSNLSTLSDSFGGHYLTTWIQGEDFQITKQIVSEALHVLLVHRPTYPYSEIPPIDDVMTLLCGRTVTWGTEPKLNSHELTKLNYILFRIVCHSIFPTSYVYTIPIDRCVFLYALITNGSIYFLLFLFKPLLRCIEANLGNKVYTFQPLSI